MKVACKEEERFGYENIFINVHNLDKISSLQILGISELN
jgi:hypothetical protein